MFPSEEQQPQKRHVSSQPGSNVPLQSCAHRDFHWLLIIHAGLGCPPPTGLCSLLTHAHLTCVFLDSGEITGKPGFSSMGSVSRVTGGRFPVRLWVQRNSVPPPGRRPPLTRGESRATCPRESPAQGSEDVTVLGGPLDLGKTDWPPLASPAPPLLTWNKKRGVRILCAQMQSGSVPSSTRVLDVHPEVGPTGSSMSCQGRLENVSSDASHGLFPCGVPHFVKGFGHPKIR